MITVAMTLCDGEDKLDAFLQFNERAVLIHAGALRADAARREAARLAADVEDMTALGAAQRQWEGKGRGRKK